MYRMPQQYQWLNGITTAHDLPSIPPPLPCVGPCALVTEGLTGVLAGGML